jgi:hypothetical protein
VRAASPGLLLLLPSPSRPLSLNGFSLRVFASISQYLSPYEGSCKKGQAQASGFGHRLSGTGWHSHAPIRIQGQRGTKGRRKKKSVHDTNIQTYAVTELGELNSIKDIFNGRGINAHTHKHISSEHHRSIRDTTRAPSHLTNRPFLFPATPLTLISHS